MSQNQRMAEAESHMWTSSSSEQGQLEQISQAMSSQGLNIEYFRGQRLHNILATCSIV